MEIRQKRLTTLEVELLGIVIDNQLNIRNTLETYARKLHLHFMLCVEYALTLHF